MGPAIITTVGILFLLSELRVAYFDRTWPIIILVIGAVKLLQSSAHGCQPQQSSRPWRWTHFWRGNGCTTSSSE